MVSLTTTIVCSLVSAAAGFAIAVLLGRLRKPAATTSSPDGKGTQAQDQLQTERQLKSMVESLYQLTSVVDSQVGEHTLRVTEITNSLESPEDSNPSTVVSAGKLLVTANQKLQADLEEAKSEIRQQREQASIFMQESRTDALTNLANRRAFDLEISRTFTQRRRDGQPFSLVIVDIDHFKRINDQYGHMVGDQLLKGISRCLTGALGETDFVARYGGEEFVAILNRTSLGDAMKAAERVRIAIEQNRFNVGDLDIQITASLGIKEVEPNESEIELMEKTDLALYAAKKDGRNRCFYHDGKECLLYVPDVKQAPSDSELPVIESAEGATSAESVLPMSPHKSPKKSGGVKNVEKQLQT